MDDDTKAASELARLKEENARLRTFVDQVPEGLWDWQPEAGRCHANAAYWRMFGIEDPPVQLRRGAFGEGS